MEQEEFVDKQLKNISDVLEMIHIELVKQDKRIKKLELIENGNPKRKSKWKCGIKQRF